MVGFLCLHHPSPIPSVQSLLTVALCSSGPSHTHPSVDYHQTANSAPRMYPLPIIPPQSPVTLAVRARVLARLPRPPLVTWPLLSSSPCLPLPQCWFWAPSLPAVPHAPHTHSLPRPLALSVSSASPNGHTTVPPFPSGPGSDVFFFVRPSWHFI